MVNAGWMVLVKRKLCFQIGNYETVCLMYIVNIAMRGVCACIYRKRERHV